jgi:hypothetical protein
MEEIKIKISRYIDCKKMMKTVFLCGLFIAGMTLCPGCSEALKLSSVWQKGDIALDSSGTGWENGLYLDKESDIVYGIRNNDDYVYLFFKTQNRSTQMQIMNAGFTVWFDAKGGNDHSFGIRYPLARKENNSEFHTGSDDEQMHSSIDQALLELEIIGAQKEDVQLFSILNVPGIRVKITHAQNVLSYELRVPLRKTPHTPFAVGATSANRIGIGLETEELNRDKMKMGAHKDDRLNESRSEYSQMEGEEHEGHGYQNDGRRSGFRERNKKSGQLKLWLSVQLAHTPD